MTRLIASSRTATTASTCSEVTPERSRRTPKKRSCLAQLRQGAHENCTRSVDEVSLAAVVRSFLLVAALATAASADPRPPLVILDPGHGGSNAGAKGVVEGLHEKQL